MPRKIWHNNAWLDIGGSGTEIGPVDVTFPGAGNVSVDDSLVWDGSQWTWVPKPPVTFLGRASGSGETGHTVTFTGLGVQAGDVLIYLAGGNGGAAGAPAGWTEVWVQAANTTWGRYFYRTATGSLTSVAVSGGGARTFGYVLGFRGITETEIKWGASVYSASAPAPTGTTTDTPAGVLLMGMMGFDSVTNPMSGWTNLERLALGNGASILQKKSHPGGVISASPGSPGGQWYGGQVFVPGVDPITVV